MRPFSPRTAFLRDRDLAVLVGSALGLPPVAALATFPARATTHPDYYQIVASVPGVPASGIQVQLEGQDLTLEARRNNQAQKRVFVLPDDVDPEAISAQLALGELTVRVPRKAPKSQVKTIAVQEAPASTP